MKRIAFVTTVKGRAEHLKSTLPKNLADNASYSNAVFVVLDYSSPDDLLPYLFDNYGHEMESGRLAIYSFLDPNPGPFRMSHAKNMAARCGLLEGADILVTLDADNYTGPGFAEFISDNLEKGSFLCPDFPLIHSLPHGPTRPERGYAGRLAIRAQDFIKVGGYDEIFDQWGSEDMDMIFRLQRMGYSMRHIPNSYLRTIPHPAVIRFKEYPEAQKFETKQHVQTIAARDETVVNYGRIGLGEVLRHNQPKLTFTLRPLPTRVFGIGMHKTATSSLHKAFQTLGFDSLHWGTGEAPRIWQEMTSSGRSTTLEKWYALSDNPIPLLYKQLDKAYPGSKFILTIRDEQDWLKSVERLYDRRYNPTRWVWDVYPFTNHIHTVLYGRKDFDAKIMLARYRRHNAEVLEYFKYRSDDLLFIDIPTFDNRWELLCHFLDKPIPDVPFPWSNDTRQNVFIAAAAGIYGEPSTTEPRHRKHHHASWLKKLWQWICRWWHRV